MKYQHALLGLLFLMGIFTLGPSSGTAYEVGYLRLTGKLLPVEAEKNGNRRGAIEAIIDGRHWVFEVSSADNLKGSGPSGRSILRQLFPARISIKGDHRSLDELLPENGSAKDIAIVGFFYPASGVFFVTSVNKPHSTGRADSPTVKRRS